MSTAHGARARARIEVTAAIKEAARRQLAAEGAAKLSLRAAARELGMASSALYRYFPSRDELLTALIIDAYDSSARPPKRPTPKPPTPRRPGAGPWCARARVPGRSGTRTSTR